MPLNNSAANSHLVINPFIFLTAHPVQGSREQWSLSQLFKDERRGNPEQATSPSQG